MNCFSGTLKPLTATCGSAGSSPLGSGATARRLFVKLDVRRDFGYRLDRARAILRMADAHIDVQ
jgi:hypothetical protein